jgi:hypothetical protein
MRCRYTRSPTIHRTAPRPAGPHSKLRHQLQQCGMPFIPVVLLNLFSPYAFLQITQISK